MIGVKITKSGFQDRCAGYLFDKLFDPEHKTIIIKSPTGSGKTVILNDFIERISDTKANLVFVWLTPGKGDLEQQSKISIEKRSPELVTKDLWETINSGFEPNDITFVNWELLTKKGNKALKSSERKTLFDQISIAHKKGYSFILIIDEEHSNDTRKAQDLIDAFSALKEIRVSATARFTNDSFNYEISEREVIDEEFITKGIYINIDVNEGEIDDTTEYIKLIDHGLSKREEILNEYKKLPGAEYVNPLMIIQFPNQSQKLISIVEDYLNQKHDINYSNLTLGIWMADINDKKNIGKISDDDDSVQVLLMKQAISTGWDCRRAKILIKLRENMNEDFEIQTIGRIRRMPRLRHYNVNLIDYCFLYTLDDKYVSGVRESTKYIFSEKQLVIKEKGNEYHLIKESRDENMQTVDERQVMNAIFEHFEKKYFVKGRIEINLLIDAGYTFKKTIVFRAKRGLYETTDEIINSGSILTLESNVDTSIHGIDLLHNIYSLTKIISIEYEKLVTILNGLFRKGFGKRSNKILSLDIKEFYAFMLNNYDQIEIDFKEATERVYKYQRLFIHPKETDFSIPKSDRVKYDSFSRSKRVMNSNIYENYTEEMLVEGLKSKSERLFERYCELNKNINWIYKNGDSGEDYFSIVYQDTLGKQWLFFPDYIVRMNDNTIWIIETKGGEANHQSKNIDKKASLKFDALKDYCGKYQLNWGFVRDSEENLYFNNTIYSEQLDESLWLDIRDIF